MKERNNGPMPPEYGYLNAPLSRAQEHVFLIDEELERLERQGNPLDEDKLIKLQDERRNVVHNLKSDFESQTWEDGPARTEEIHSIIDKQLNTAAYNAAREALAVSGKTYATSNYWQDRLERNLATWHEQYGVYDDPGKLDDFEYTGLSDDYDDLDRD